MASNILFNYCGDEFYLRISRDITCNCYIIFINEKCVIFATNVLYDVTYHYNIILKHLVYILKCRNILGSMELIGIRLEIVLRRTFPKFRHPVIHQILMSMIPIFVLPTLCRQPPILPSPGFIYHLLVLVLHKEGTKYFFFLYNISFIYNTRPL